MEKIINLKKEGYLSFNEAIKELHHLTSKILDMNLSNIENDEDKQMFMLLLTKRLEGVNSVKNLLEEYNVYLD